MEFIVYKHTHIAGLQTLELYVCERERQREKNRNQTMRRGNWMNRKRQRDRDWMKELTKAIWEITNQAA